MKIKLELELDTETQQDVELIESIVETVRELKEQLGYEEENE